jgi:predicted Holliday junction resolvase-like endonuclease
MDQEINPINQQPLTSQTPFSSNIPPTKKSMPTWQKALIIGLIVFMILALLVIVVRRIRIKGDQTLQKRQALIERLKQYGAIKENIARINSSLKNLSPELRQKIKDKIKARLEERRKSNINQTLTSQNSTISCEGTVEKQGIYMAAFSWPALFTYNPDIGLPQIELKLQDNSKSIKIIKEDGTELCKKLVTTNTINPMFWNGTWAEANKEATDNIATWSTGQISVYASNLEYQKIGSYFVKYAIDSQDSGLIAVSFDDFSQKDSYINKEIIVTYNSTIEWQGQTSNSVQRRNAGTLGQPLECNQDTKTCWYEFNDIYNAFANINEEVEGYEVGILTEKPITKQDPCKVESVTKIRPGSFPRTSPQGKITFTNEVNDQFEVFTMNADFSNIKCLTCGKAALVNTRNRGQSAWSPDEKYIIFTAENASIPRKPETYQLDSSTRPGIGRNFNIWIMTSDGNKFWQLTNYPENWGVIEPYFSYDGNMITWGEEFMMNKYPSGKNQGESKWPSDPKYSIGHPGCYWNSQNLKYRKGEELCIWRTKYGKINYDTTGKPIITDLKIVNPPANFTMVEPQGFTFDNKGFVYSYSDLTKSPDKTEFWPDLYTTDLNGGNLKQLINTPQIEEEIAYSPDGKKILIKRMDKYPGTNDEIWLMNADGSNMTQLTHFNTPGYPEYDQNAKQNTEQSWDPSGKSFVMGHVSSTGLGAGGANLPSQLFRITFAGACGKQN